MNPTGARHRSWFSWRTWAAGVVLAGVAGLGCQNEAPPNAPKDPNVQVSRLVSGKVSDYEVFTGRTQTMHYQDIKARVTGYLEKIYFKEGDDVQEGAPSSTSTRRPTTPPATRPRRPPTRPTPRPNRR